MRRCLAVLTYLALTGCAAVTRTTIPDGSRVAVLEDVVTTGGSALKAIERAFGRRERRRWGPREIDLDLLLFGDAAIRIERPHDDYKLDLQATKIILNEEIPANRFQLEQPAGAELVHVGDTQENKQP